MTAQPYETLFLSTVYLDLPPVKVGDAVAITVSDEYPSIITPGNYEVIEVGPTGYNLRLMP